LAQVRPCVPPVAAMAALRALREAYANPVARSRFDDGDGDTDQAWPEFGAQTVGEDESEKENLESEWDAVAERTDTLRLEHKANFGKIQPKDDASSSQISYKEVQSWLSQLCVDSDLDRQRRNGKDLVLLLKAMPFDFNVSTHFRMLRTLFTKLTLNKWCPSIGNHWEVVGFQAGDPRTDLNRSGGVLNVLHLFFFVAHHLELATIYFQMSQDEQQNFPLACISINITRMVVESLLAGRLSALCSKESGEHKALEMTCKMHSAGLFYFCSRWRSQKRTIQHTEQTLKELKELLDRKPAKLLEDLAQGEKKKSVLRAPVAEFADLEALKDTVQAPLLSQKSRGLWARSKAAVLPKRLRRYSDVSGAHGGS